MANDGEEADIDADLILPEHYTFIPIRALRITSRKKIAKFLDLDGTLIVCNDMDIVTNYNGLAELAGFEYLDIRNMMQMKSPTEELLHMWTIRANDLDATIDNLWKFLFQMERFDVLKDCRRTILNDCRIYEQDEEISRDVLQYQIEQDPTVSNSEMKVDETKYACVQDVRAAAGGKPQTMFDAFICYTAEDENDRKFVREIIHELEVNRHLKLFIPGRDDLPGAAEHTISAYLIEVRCKRVVILMSRMFLKSSACDFQMKFAHALSPGARSKKLIPVIRDRKISMPRLLTGVAVCDFSKADMKDWVWDRLVSAIEAPMGPVTYFEKKDSSNPFQYLNSIRFPNPEQWLSAPPKEEENKNKIPHKSKPQEELYDRGVPVGRRGQGDFPVRRSRDYNSDIICNQNHKGPHEPIENYIPVSNSGSERQPVTNCERPEPVESSYTSMSIVKSIKPDIASKPKNISSHQSRSHTKLVSPVVGSPTIDSTTSVQILDYSSSGETTWV